MLRCAWAVGLLFAAVPQDPAPAGATVEGTVTLPEPPRKPPKPPRYPGGKAPADYVRGPAVVFIDGVTGAWAPPKDRPALEQKNRQFNPLALAVLKGTTVSFPNRDEEYHNVFSRSRAKELELGRYGKDETREVLFDAPGLVRLRCEIHTDMHAVIVVLENPCFAVADGKGAFSIRNVPPGKYRIHAFHEDYEPKDEKADPLRAVGRDVEVPGDGAVHVDFDLRDK